MKARGREIYIIAGVVAVVLIVAWYFLLFNPTRQELAQLDEQIATATTTLQTTQQQLVRLEEYKKTAPQARVEVVRLGKLLPDGEGQPSLIVELNRTAELAGVTIGSISRGSLENGQPFGIQTLTLSVTGRFFDVVDFVYRVEDYVAVRNTQVKATGRLLQMTSLQMTANASTAAETTTTDPMLTVSLDVTGYLWGGGSAPAADTVAQTEGGAQ
ncbi:MAG TPA: type 4a pilus biogenesis protein PilO [Thermoleophilia bacterium]|nr:type 4a pilus biogenesis protein PilO [Thermoleophilia bacterium]